MRSTRTYDIGLAARAELQSVCVSARFHQLSLSLRPGGQRTGVPCVQFLLAFQIIANEPNAPFLSVSLQMYYCHLQADRGRAPCRLHCFGTSSFSNNFTNFSPNVKVNKNAPPMSVFCFCLYNPCTVFVLFCFFFFCRRQQQPHLKVANVEDDPRRR